MTDRNERGIPEMNREILVRLSRFLQGPANLGEQEVRMLAEEVQLPLDQIACIMLGACLGLDTDRAYDRALMEQYVQPGFRLLSAREYQADPYRQTIRFPKTKSGDWTFEEKEFAPFEVFIRDDLLLPGDGREIPRTGAFSERFPYPTVLQGGREWMTLAPVEIETMKRPIALARGHVLTFGLGMGYYAFHVCRKPEVQSLTVVEKDAELIRMFRDLLCPQFPERQKMRIVCADAYDYLEENYRPEQFDSVFCDFWHDAGDGTEHYLRLREIEKRYQTRFLYWAEGLLRQQAGFLKSEQNRND
ncbi:MAG: hypothetical protein IJ088_11120 [Clostridia bacterium]|nr:hypothetical protein [Clostridia bacterium]